MISVRAGLVSPAVVFLPLWVADGTGEFATRGVEIETTVLGTTDGTTTALLDGAVDLAFATPDPALLHPDRVSVLAGLVDRPPLSMIAQPELSTWESLRGRGIGTSSYTEGTVHLIKAMMAAHGLRLDEDYHLVLAGAHPQRWQALQDRTLDAALQLMPFDTIAEDAGYVLLGRADEVVPDFAFSSVTARTDWIAEHPMLASAVTDALIAAEARIREDPTAAAEIAARNVELPVGLALRCVERLVEGGVMPAGLRHGESALAEARRALATAGGDQE